MSQELFRSEALAHHARTDEHGDVLRYDKRWPRRVYAVLLGAFAAAFLLVSLLGINEYAIGPAVVRVDARRVVTSSAPGSVESVEVRPGQAVDVGTVLVRMHHVEEEKELDRATREFNLELVRMLRDPADPTTKQSLTSLRSARDQARNVVGARVIRATVRGYVSDVRVQVGQHVNAGEVLATVAPEGTSHVSVTAMVPADYRPMLERGAPMRFELDGFRFEYTDLVVTEVSAEAVGTAEVQRFLGQERGDAVPLEPGAKVFVTARLPTPTFTSEGREYGYFDGLTGQASVSVRRETILVTLIPALRQWQLPQIDLTRIFRR